MYDEILVQNWFEKSVSALATKSRFTTSKHHQLLGWFNKNYIHTKKIDRDVAEIYRICLENRQRCDYIAIHKPTKEKLQEHFDKVERLIDAVKTLLQVE